MHPSIVRSIPLVPFYGIPLPIQKEGNQNEKDTEK